MVNTDDFIKRLEFILEYYGLNASSFADKIGVQRSSLSHLLSGRNKPSLDFILKILDVFPEVDLYWVLNGKGTFPKSETENETHSPAQTLIESAQEFSNEKTVNLFSEELPSSEKWIQEKTTPTSQNTTELKNSSEIDRIVIFYKNGTFKTYSSE
ncbi:helix-turn-helix domain-containing protein [Flavobacterium eburneipallidum]|uniref:helix-turn-helix domain-containing protein n=1 Tax=Flavobacterium eburneipallidum TaxID=3003263 RepID=UPI0022AC333E|nr:helix-turn-helix transcriptional regulator [Flavobacterium eburneipallidum]